MIPFTHNPNSHKEWAFKYWLVEVLSHCIQSKTKEKITTKNTIKQQKKQKLSTEWICSTCSMIESFQFKKNTPKHPKMADPLPWTKMAVLVQLKLYYRQTSCKEIKNPQAVVAYVGRLCWMMQRQEDHQFKTSLDYTINKTHRKHSSTFCEKGFCLLKGATSIVFPCFLWKTNKHMALYWHIPKIIY